MATYIVLEPASAAPDKAEKAVMVRDGFAVLAFIVPLFWFLWHRMWLEALGYLAIGLLLAGLGMLPGYSVLASILSILLSFLVALEAQALRVAALRRRGWEVWGVVEANNRDEAEIRYAAEVEQPEVQRPAAAPPAVPAAPRAQSPKAPGPSFGLLDYPRRN